MIAHLLLVDGQPVEHAARGAGPGDVAFAATSSADACDKTAAKTDIELREYSRINRPTSAAHGGGRSGSTADTGMGDAPFKLHCSGQAASALLATKNTAAAKSLCM